MHTPRTRRAVVRSLAAAPVAAALVWPRLAIAQANQLVVFNGRTTGAPPEGPAGLVAGWAALTDEGWLGRVVDTSVATAEADLKGFAAGVTRVVPKGTPNTLNGRVGPDGTRVTDTCFSEVVDGTIDPPFFRLEAKLEMAQNNLIFLPGDPVTVEGNQEAGEFVFTIFAAGQERVINMTGQILIA